MKEVVLGEPRSFLDHVYLGCTQRECETSKDIVDNHRKMFESRISAGAKEKLPCAGKLDANISTWSYDMEGHAKKNVWSDIASWPTKQTQQLYKVTTPCLDDHQFQEEELGSVGELSKVCSQIVLKCLYLARIGRPDTLWSADKLARTVTKWTRACDKRLARLIYHLHHTSDFKQYHHVGNTAQQCSLGLFQDSDFAGDLEDSKSISGRMLCIFGSHTFVPTSWMCKKQTSVSHSSTESEITSLDAGLRMDGIPALDLRDLASEVLHSSSNQPEKSQEKVQGDLLRDTPSRRHTNSLVQTPIQHNDLELSNVDFVSSNVKSSQLGAMLYIFEDNEAVIKMIIKGRSPTMRHISRTHRVALDLLFDRINLDPKIQIKYVDTKKQLTIFSLCSISAFSSLPAAPKRCRKRMQQGTGEERIVAKLKPTLAASSSTAPSSSAFHRPGMLRAPRQSLKCRETCG